MAFRPRFSQSPTLAAEPYLLALGQPPSPGVARRAYLIHAHFPRWTAQIVDMTDLRSCQGVDPEADIVALDDRYALVGVTLIDEVDPEFRFDWDEALIATQQLLF